MPPYGVAYKEAKPAAELLELDERLWAHIRTAKSVVESWGCSATPSAPSAVVLRPAGAEPVIIVLMAPSTHAPSRGEELCHRFGLTPREAEVALLLADRMSCREIGERLHVSFHTARSHTERILMKLRVRSKHDVGGRLASND